MTSRGIRRGNDFVPMHAISSVDLRMRKQAQKRLASRLFWLLSWVALLGGAAVILLGLPASLGRIAAFLQ